MTMRNVQGRSQRAAGESSNKSRLTSGLGWFSVGLGLAEVIAPGALAGLIGIRKRPNNQTLLRVYGLRELAAGAGILTQPRPTGWLWARVAGDAVDLASLASATRTRRNDKGRIAIAMASVAGVTALDVYCARQQCAASRDTTVVRTIIVDRPADEVYNAWHDFENLPRFMTHLESVRTTGEHRTHWVAKGPAGSTIEWDADTVVDQPNRTLAWRSVEGSEFENSGSIHFDRAPGDRGTLVRVELDFSRNRSAAILGKLMKMDLGRRIMHDLRNFKQMLEVGEVTQSEASVHPGLHPAQPQPVHQY